MKKDFDRPASFTPKNKQFSDGGIKTKATQLKVRPWERGLDIVFSLFFLSAGDAVGYKNNSAMGEDNFRKLFCSTG